MSTIINTAIDFRRDISCNITQLSDEVFIRYYNDSRDELISEITEEKEDYFFDYFFGSTVVGQNEYKLAKRGDLATDGITVLDGINKIKGVSWRINTEDVDYTKLEPKTLENLDYDLDSYKNSQLAFYVLQDNSIFLFPTPKVISDFKFSVIKTPKKLALTDTDTLPDNHTKVILYGVKKMYLESQTRNEEALKAESDWEKGKIKVRKALSGRIQAPIQRSEGNINYLK